MDLLEIIKGFGKNIHDSIGMKSQVYTVLFGPDGKIKDVREIKNTWTQVGDAHVADQLSDQGNAAVGWMAVGTTSGGKSTASTTLEAEAARVALDSTTQGAGAADNDVVYVGTFGAGVGTGALVEAGLFNAGAAGVMMCYTEWAVVNKGASDTLVVTWTATFGAS